MKSPAPSGHAKATTGWVSSSDHLLQLLNSPWYPRLMNLMSITSKATHDFFVARGAVAALFPVTTSSVSSPMGLGSDSEPVVASIKGQDTFLSDSMQFCLELGCRILGQPCYYVMPSFRGERADDRHLCEFFHSELEMPGGFEQIIAVAEEYVRYLTSAILAAGPTTVLEMVGTTSHLQAIVERTTSFTRLEFSEARTLLQNEEAFEELPGNVWRLTHAGERELIKRFGDFVWITNMPWRSVPFYQAKRGDGIYALNADLLAGYGEILGCGERATTALDVQRNLQDQGVPVEPYGWYLEMKRQSQMQTAGFGLGIERYLMWVLQVKDIRRLALLQRQWGELLSP